jgi:drug/metabolite transporter (DMT)-like permease
MLAYLSLLIAQLLYSSSDAWKKILLGEYGFSWSTLTRPAFLAAMLLGAVGFVFQMHALSKLELSRTIVTLTVFAIVFAAIIGVALFKDQMHWWNYLGIGFAVAAVVLVNWRG